MVNQGGNLALAQSCFAFIFRHNVFDALQAHRLGAVDKARRLYQSAMEKAPLDARLPFLAAVLEIDFANDLIAAEKLALKATSLDAIHPDGKALVHEIRLRLKP